MEIPSNKYLGRLCKCGHDYCDTGMSLRYKKGYRCVLCEKIRKQTPECKAWKKEWQRKYCRSAKGRESQKRTRQSEKRKAYLEQYTQPEEYKTELKKQLNQKYQTDPYFRLNRLMSSGILSSLKNGSKNGRHWEELVPYTNYQLEIHLKSTIPEGYTWQDFLDGKLHIDHIIPISAFNFSSPEHLDFQRCWALSNLQLLPARENIIKYNKLSESFQPSLAL